MQIIRRLAGLCRVDGDGLRIKGRPLATQRLDDGWAENLVGQFLACVISTMLTVEFGNAAVAETFLRLRNTEAEVVVKPVGAGL